MSATNEPVKPPSGTPPTKPAPTPTTPPVQPPKPGAMGKAEPANRMTAKEISRRLQAERPDLTTQEVTGVPEFHHRDVSNFAEHLREDNFEHVSPSPTSPTGNRIEHSFDSSFYPRLVSHLESRKAKAGQRKIDLAASREKDAEVNRRIRGMSKSESDRAPLSKAESDGVWVREFVVPMGTGGIQRWHVPCLKNDDSDRSKIVRGRDPDTDYSREAARSLRGSCAGCGGELGADGPAAKKVEAENAPVYGEENQEQEMSKAEKPAYKAGDKVFTTKLIPGGDTGVGKKLANIPSGTSVTVAEVKNVGTKSKPQHVYRLESGHHVHYADHLSKEPLERSEFLPGARHHYQHLLRAQRLGKSEEARRHAALCATYMVRAGLPAGEIPASVTDGAGVDLTKSEYPMDKNMKAKTMKKNDMSPLTSPLTMSEDPRQVVYTAIKSKLAKCGQMSTGAAPVAKAEPMVKAGARKPGAAPANPRPAKSHNEDAVRELQLYTENDGNLHRQMGEPITRNLANKMASGDYDHNLAAKAFSHLYAAGAQKYTKEFGTPGPHGNFGSFSPADRMEAGRRAADHFRTEAQLGNYDQFLHKKYAGKSLRQGTPPRPEPTSDGQGSKMDMAVWGNLDGKKRIP